MQLKGLIRFFTILLILYSIYELSFTWVVRGHENKMEKKAEQWVARVHPNADSATKAQAKAARLKRLLDSTKDVTVHYGFTGAISYDRAKREELNLGLDLKGGINVTMQVELSGLIRSLANNSKDANFNKALANATARKLNTSADYISLFVEEYKKLVPNGRLAALFSTSNDRIKINDSDDKVISELRSSAYDAFDNTYRVLRTRIDQFGVAQPNINPDRERDIITVELPGLQDPERVRRYLQSSANLQFWLVYKSNDPGMNWEGADRDYAAYLSGGTVDADTATINVADTSSAATGDTAAKAAADTARQPGQRSLFQDYVKSMVGDNIAVAIT
ncbi:MAG TPA: protein translocase subunit SecDF, partial [Chitinophagaceae bacterium]|nr:protein translocase subunit SecDF [Chitinophagaceae bacterium]